MKPSFAKVLAALNETPDRFVLASHLPDGNGRGGCASGLKLREMRQAGLIEYGRNEAHSHYGYRITFAGREALALPRAERGTGS